MADLASITGMVTAEDVPIAIEYRSRRTFSGVVSACVCSICLVIIIVFSTVQRFAGHSPVVWGLEAILTTIGGIFTYALWVIIHKHGEQNIQKNTEDVTIRMKIIFLWLFGIVNILNSAINMAINCDCIAKDGKEQFPGDQEVSIATHIFEIIFNTGQLGFISSYSPYRLKSSTFLNYGISTIILTHVIRWFRTLFASLLNNNLISIKNESNTFRNNCFWTSELSSFRKEIEPWIEPTLTEYSLLAVSLMLRMWISSEEKAKETSNFSIHNERTPLLNQASVQSLNSCVSKGISTNEHSLQFALKNSSVYICILVGIMLCLPILTTVIMASAVQTYTYHYQLSTVIVQCVFKVELFTIILLAYFFFYKQYEEEMNADRFNSSRFILILCTAGSIAYSTFGLIAGFMNKHAEFHAVASALVVQKLFEITCIYLQTVLILQSSSYNTVRLKTFSKGIPVYKIYCVLFIINITMWLVNSYMGKDNSRIMSVETRFYGTYYWRAVHDVVFPITIFYRFHTAMDIYQLYRKYETLHTLRDKEI
ncbi:proton channel OtopLc-like [Saccostrea echinata]|uniref:proton channel OtopLc-like n=1 Tax=Saccostrea echinata TaxID=191078 RepID=UPI002A826C6B|nr:proton channel OtopLc-like [Saccostrea echinata]